MATWVIEGEGGGRFTCHGKCWPAALNLARQHNREVLVRYQGPKRPGNRSRMRSDFVARPNGDIDCSIDPTWWLHGK